MNDNSFFFLLSDSACLKFTNEIKVQNGTSQDVHQKNLAFTGFRSHCSTNTSLINYQLDKAHHSADKGTQFLTSSLCEVLAHQKTGNVCTIYICPHPQNCLQQKSKRSEMQKMKLLSCSKQHTDLKELSDTLVIPCLCWCVLPYYINFFSS